MPIKNVIMHFGMPKTGSSSIQHTLFHNSEILEKNSFRYLTEWELNHARKLYHIFKSGTVRPINDRYWGKPISKIQHDNNIKKLTDKMQQVINTASSETLVLSGECFEVFRSPASIEILKNFISKYFKNKSINVKIVLLVRNPLPWVISSLQQQISRCRFLRSVDFFDDRMLHYEAVGNLIKNFPELMTLIKFEDACLDKDGLVGYFLKKIGFPEKNIHQLEIKRVNESRCMEAMEFINFIESIEPLSLHSDFETMNPNRSITDLSCTGRIKGIKFDLPHQSKVELWERLQETALLLKKNTGIDYTDYVLPPSATSIEPEIWNEETIHGFIEVFPQLSPVIQRLFLKFFEMKYAETAQEKFKLLYFKGSVPWEMYNSKNTFLTLSIFHIKNRLPKFMPAVIKKQLKRLLAK